MKDSSVCMTDCDKFFEEFPLLVPVSACIYEKTGEIMTSKHASLVIALITADVLPLGKIAVNSADNNIVPITLNR